MRCVRMAFVGLLAVASVGATGCGGSSSSGSATAAAGATASPAAGATGASTTSVPVAKRGVVTISMATVGDPGNPSVGVVQTFGGPKGKFVDPPKGTGIYKTCKDAPAAPPPCLTVGGVGYTFGIGKYEVTVSQYVTFLNTADPDGRNPHDLYIDNMSPQVWPQYGSVSYSPGAAAGAHYSVAYPEWADKPFNFGDFRRGARFANSLTNGTVLSQSPSSSGDFKYVAYKVRLSPRTEQGMYDMRQKTPTRTASTGFVVSSNNEWVKAAYYDPKGGGTDSYWAYPTGPFNPPNPSKLNPSNGDVVNADTQPLATYNPNDPNSSVDTPGSPAGAAPTWCPRQAGSTCGKVFPPNLPPGLDLPSLYMANVSTVGQAKTTSPWGTYDQGGNVVEVLDSLAPQPPGYKFLRDWRYYHGGVANAPAYQVEISAFGYFPGDPGFEHVYPWLGFRLGVIGNLK
jgi:formylglycine-generating enzyme required for sulfatase activity